MRVVFVIRQLGYARLFDAPLRALLGRGATVHLLYDRDVGNDRERAWLAGLQEQPGFSSSLTDALRRDPWFRVAARLRRYADYLHFLSPAFAGMPTQVARAEERLGRGAASVVRLLARPEPVRAAASRALRALERWLPPSDAARAELRGADVLVLAPHLMPGARHTEWIRAARAEGIPCVVAVASWDNLTSKQHLREVPDRVVVWNDTQKNEAVTLHDVPEELVVVTGAQSFDDWFDRTPRPREEFCARVGLDPARPYLAWLGGALFKAALTEAEFVEREWLPRFRADDRFRDVQLLVRPHPRRLQDWASLQADVVVWPRAAAAMPVDEESRADFFDSIHHSSAVVGINTTAMIEAAIVGRGVYTLYVPEFAESQRGVVHFEYLLTIGGGIVQAADTWDQHFDELAHAIAEPEAGRERRDAFVRAFVRPAGPAVPNFVAAVEGAAALTPRHAAPHPAHALVRAAVSAKRRLWSTRAAARVARARGR